MPRRLKSKRKTKRTHDGELPVSSFSDIAFLLIIFFILVTSLTKTMGFTTEIPAGEKSEQQEEKSASITIRDSQFFLNDQPTTMAELPAALANLKLPQQKTDNQRTVLVEAVGKVPYQAYFSVLAAVSDAGGIIAIVQADE